MRRSGLRSIRNQQKTKTLKDASIEDCRVFAYYLYELCSYRLDNYPDAEDDDCFIYSLFSFFEALARKMGKEKVVLNYLSKIILQYRNNKVLTELPENTATNSDLLFFDNTDIPYSYEEDKKIDRMRTCTGDRLTFIEINLRRIHYVSDSTEFLLSLIANFLINKTPSQEACLLEKIPLYLKRSLNSTGKFEFVKIAVGLTDEEISFLKCCYILSTNKRLSNLMETFPESCQLEIKARILGFSERQISALMRQDSKLRLYGFISEDGKIEDDFFDCVEAGSMQPFFFDLLKKVDCNSCYNLESFNVPDNTKNLMSRMLKSKESVSFLLYGKPGSGKTEFAKALAKQSGLKTYIFKNIREVSREREFTSNIYSRLNCLLSMSSSDSIYIIDEADTILNTCDSTFFGMRQPSKIKGTINSMLEQSRNKIIWIVNFTSQIDESTLRRFTYSYKFDSMTKAQLRSITESKLKSLDLPCRLNNQILDLMEQYKVTGASVENVIKTIRSLGEENCNRDGLSDGSALAAASLVQDVKSVLKENALLINGKSRMRETVSGNYDLSVLNASMNPGQIVRMIQNATDFAEKSGGTGDAQNGIRMLFYGVSGTGKTEFARYIAQSLGKPILLKRASDILSKYVGESEQNIRDAFDEAARTDSILLFDEADSFFASRENAQYNWERTQVNEFLTQMEEFPGILICTTNLKQIMDSAMNRRFHIITEFKPLVEDGIRTLLDRYFSGMTFEDSQIRRLTAMNSVTPGDFGVLASRVRFMDSDERTPDYIINELFKIQEEKQNEGAGRKIGFGAA